MDPIRSFTPSPPFGSATAIRSILENFLIRKNVIFSRSPLGSNMYTYLKFGLPRVFPPNGSRHRDGSSGYDSSDDGMTPRNAQNKKSQSYYLRTRSDPDFRNAPYCGVGRAECSEVKKQEVL